MFRYTEVLRWIVLRLVYLNYSRCSLCFFFSGQRMKDIKCHEDSWLRSWGRSKVITGDEPGGGKPKSEFICGKFPLISGCGRLVKILEWYWLMVIRSGTCVHAYIYIYSIHIYIYIYLLHWDTPSGVSKMSKFPWHSPCCNSPPRINRRWKRLPFATRRWEREFFGVEIFDDGGFNIKQKSAWINTFPTSLVLGKERI